MSGLVPKRLRAFSQVSDYNWLIHDCMAGFLGEAALHAHGVLVDIGCGNKPWRSLFAERVREYFGIDLADSYNGIDEVGIIGTAYTTGHPEAQVNTLLDKVRYLKTYTMAKQLKNRLIYHIHDRALQLAVSEYFKGCLIDIGCGTKPYRDMVKPFVTEHVGVDHAESSHSTENVDLIGTAYAIPAPEASFDSALCTYVLEHLEEPEQALRECYRVLKPGGVAIYSVPFIWHLHEEPRDFYRFSKYGLAYLFGKAGFQIVEIKALSGFWVTFGQLLVYNLYRFNRGPLRWLRIIDGLGLAVQGISYLLDRVDRTEQWTCDYMITARKP